MVIDIVEIPISFIVFALPMLVLPIQKWDQFKVKEATMPWITERLVSMELERVDLEPEEKARST